MKYYYLQHIPKTAGTSIRHFMWKHGPKHNFKFIWSNDWGRPHERFRPKEEIAKLAKVPIHKLTTFTFLRDPYEHSRSLYLWIRKDTNHPYHKQVSKIPLTRWLQTYKPLENYFCKFLGGGPDQAARNLATFDYVGFIENVDLVMNTMLGEYNLKFEGSKRYYVTKHLKINQQQKHIIRERRPLDFQLLGKLPNNVMAP